jgi:hypothetical protein
VVLTIDSRSLTTTFAETPLGWQRTIDWLAEQLSLVLPDAGQGSLIQIRVT